MRHTLEVLFSVVAVVLNVAFVWPQALKLHSTRDTTGVSPGTWTISVTLFSVWAAFALRTQYWSLSAANLSSLAAAGLIMLVGTRSGWPGRWLVLCGAGVAGAAALALLAPAVLAVVMTGAGVALRLPQILRLWRSRSASGVSASTWWLGGSVAATWLVVSSLRGATAVIVANSTALAATVVLLAVLYWRRRQGPAV